MGNGEPSRPQGVAKPDAGELVVRVGSALVLAPPALLLAYLGGWAFELFWGIAAAVVMWEWAALVTHGGRRSVLLAGIASVVLALLLASRSIDVAGPVQGLRLPAALLALALGMLLVGALAAGQWRGWAAAGVPYAGAIGLCPIVLRGDAEFGFVALLFLFAVVWATDIAAYFVGRMVGGPKLAPRWSPNKTWSGAIGGLAGGAIAALAVTMSAGLGGLLVITSVAIVLSMVAQAGDLFESGLKRRFGAKDSSRLIPGHGGLMDRLDGFVAAAALACVIGLARGGIEAPARGLMVW